jgi:phosphoribosylaminoimidazolecarboxamide formyltransferase/IMP cyclohydrolase
MNILPIRRALISVSDKSGLSDIAPLLIEHNVEVISSGGTANALRKLGVPVIPIQDVTGNPEAFGGRMKTLSFAISSALLFRRGHEGDEQQAKDLGINPIDLVICNLYPFTKVVERDGSFSEKIENIDIGGPTMVRAAAKNHDSVCVVVDPSQYSTLIENWTATGGTSADFRTEQALAAFRHTAIYDTHIAQQFEQEVIGQQHSVAIDVAKATALRYGENPHQKAWLVPSKGGIASTPPLQGRALSYNNMLDADASFRSCADLASIAPTRHVVTIIKHLNPCGAALADTQQEALEHAWAGDPISAFGSIICFNHPVEESSAQWLRKKFIEVIIAPEFSDEARALFAKRKKLRLLTLPIEVPTTPVLRSIFGGFLLQEEDVGADPEMKWVCTNDNMPSTELCSFGIMVTKHLRSNAIALVRSQGNTLQLIGAGMGNPNRLISTQQAIEKAQENGASDLSSCLLVSDAFFPFRDNVDRAAEAGIRTIIQPGGSIRDKEVRTACTEHNIAMACTGRRHFRH